MLLTILFIILLDTLQNRLVPIIKFNLKSKIHQQKKPFSVGHAGLIIISLIINCFNNDLAGVRITGF